jgi:hypothetical protein
MGGVDTSGVITTRTIMANKHACGNGAIVKLIRESVRAACIAVRRKAAISLAILTRKPEPTIVWATLVYLFPETLGDGMALGMKSVHVANVMPFYPAKSRVALLGSSGCAATTAQAQAARIGRRSIGLGSIMTQNITQRLTLNISEVEAVSFGNGDGLTAATFAEK